MKRTKKTKIQKMSNTWQDRYEFNIVGQSNQIKRMISNDLYDAQIPCRSNYPLNKGYRMLVFSKKYERKVKKIASKYNVGYNVDITIL